ncbi:MAG: phosphoribosyltransferase [Actinobacteria bacterium]|nr:phosphoribosyltransferase [Actinomycetota bacterium]
MLVIDDFISTGSTLREAIRALKQRNLIVIGAATACATQRRLAIG